MTEIGRRSLLAGSAALMMASATRATSAPGGLKAKAASRGLRFGSAFCWGKLGEDRGSFANPAYAALLECDCALLVPENELKWQWTRPSATDFDFRQMDQMAEYAASKGMAMRGHTLFWAPPQWYPKWLTEHDFGSRPAKAAEKLLTDHVKAVCVRYGKRIYSYDVVNEAILSETGKVRDTVVTKALGGEQMLDLMFHTAREHAPHAELVYNDYMSWEQGTEDDAHVRGVLKLLEGFRKRNIPVDALGIQSHILLPKDAPVVGIVKEFEGPWRTFLDAVVAMGYKLVITEFDVNDKKAPRDISARDQAVADYARAYLDVMLDYRQLRDVLSWGICDRYSWLEEAEPRADKLPKRGLPYDRDFAPKPLYRAMAAALSGAPSR